MEVAELVKKRLFCVLYASLVLFMFAAFIYSFGAVKNDYTS